MKHKTHGVSELVLPTQRSVLSIDYAPVPVWGGIPLDSGFKNPMGRELGSLIILIKWVLLRDNYPVLPHQSFIIYTL